MWEFSSWLVTLTRPLCSSTTSQTTWRAATSDHFSHLRLTCWPLTWPPAYILQQSSPTLICYTDVVTELPCHLETLHRYYNMVILQFPHRRQSLRRSALQDHLFSWGNLFLSVSLRRYHNSYLTTFSLFLWLSVELNLLSPGFWVCRVNPGLLRSLQMFLTPWCLFTARRPLRDLRAGRSASQAHYPVAWRFRFIALY